MKEETVQHTTQHYRTHHNSTPQHNTTLQHTTPHLRFSSSLKSIRQFLIDLKGHHTEQQFHRQSFSYLSQEKSQSRVLVSWYEGQYSNKYDIAKRTEGGTTNIHRLLCLSENVPSPRGSDSCHQIASGSIQWSYIPIKIVHPVPSTCITSSPQLKNISFYNIYLFVFLIAMHLWLLR